MRFKVSLDQITTVIRRISLLGVQGSLSISLSWTSNHEGGISIDIEGYMSTLVLKYLLEEALSFSMKYRGNTGRSPGCFLKIPFS